MSKDVCNCYIYLMYHIPIALKFEVDTQKKLNMLFKPNNIFHMTKISKILVLTICSELILDIMVL